MRLWDQFALRTNPSQVRQTSYNLLRNQLLQPYIYGTIVHMKKTFNLDEKLFEEAKAACGASTDTETVRLGLEALVRHAAYQRLSALAGTEPHAQDIPRRREAPRAKRKTA
jgi:hypothetical protein